MAVSERWRKIPGWPYEASTLGRVRSRPRTLANGAEHGGQVLAPRSDRDGYQRVTLTDGSRRKTAGVHQLVLLAFEGRPEVRHRNGVPDDNRLENLLYGSHRDNERDKRSLRSTLTDRSGLMGLTGMEETEDGIETEVSRPSGTVATCFISLRQAAAEQVVPRTLYSLRMARHRHPDFPEPRARRGRTELFDRDDLRRWDKGPDA